MQWRKVVITVIMLGRHSACYNYRGKQNLVLLVHSWSHKNIFTGVPLFVLKHGNRAIIMTLIYSILRDHLGLCKSIQFNSRLVSLCTDR
jgi:hypothetical protein